MCSSVATNMALQRSVDVLEYHRTFSLCTVLNLSCIPCAYYKQLSLETIHNAAPLCRGLNPDALRGWHASPPSRLMWLCRMFVKALNVFFILITGEHDQVRSQVAQQDRKKYQGMKSSRAHHGDKYDKERIESLPSTEGQCQDAKKVVILPNKTDPPISATAASARSVRESPSTCKKACTM
mmetsp:Transcript_10040/g.23220  ORF Transcript_10040/g.23220 Transcript_10040/m.23220 type:complete len:181 (-) Transcript_10040:1543-2085(-)